MNKHQNWFKPWGWIYYPVFLQGIMLVLLVLVFCANVLLAVDAKSHSVSNTLYGIFPYFAPMWILLNWVASKTSSGST